MKANCRKRKNNSNPWLQVIRLPLKQKKYAGIVALRLGEYDKAINHFVQLESYTHLYSNPGKFYHSLTLMKRDLPGDAERAKQLLNDVVQNHLEGNKDAEIWLKKM